MAPVGASVDVLEEYICNRNRCQAERATSVPERAENCDNHRSTAGTANGLRRGHVQVNPLRKTTF